MFLSPPPPPTHTHIFVQKFRKKTAACTHNFPYLPYSLPIPLIHLIQFEVPPPRTPRFGPLTSKACPHPLSGPLQHLAIYSPVHSYSLLPLLHLPVRSHISGLIWTFVRSCWWYVLSHKIGRPHPVYILFLLCQSKLPSTVKFKFQPVTFLFNSHCLLASFDIRCHGL